MQTRTLLAGLAAFTLVGAAGADVVDILGDGGSITYTGTGVEFFVDENNLINGSGLDAALASDESNIATASHGNAGAGTAWVTDDPTPGGGDYFAESGGATIVFDIDLGGTHTLDSFASWGYGFDAQPDPNGNSISDVTLEFYTNGTGAGAADSSQNLSVDLVYGAADVIALAPVSANFVRLTVNDNHFPGIDPTFGGDRVGLAEIAFTNNVPEPGSLALLGLGGLALLRRRR